MRTAAAICACSLLVAVSLGGNALAQDYIQVYKYPEIKPEASVRLGYGLVLDSGSNRAGLYRYLENSPQGGLNIVAFPFPHRFYYELDYLNKNDYFMDARYAYKDIVLARWINNTSYHNLDNFTLVDLGASDIGVPSSSPDVDVRDAGVDYGIRTGINSFYLRFKTPDYPFHTFVNGRLVGKDGEAQKRFLGGDGWFGDSVRVSRKRDVDWDSGDISMGLNSHLGPVEAEYSHGEKWLDVGGDRFLTEQYTANSFEAAGTYPLAYLPDFEGSSDTIKVHSSLTGKIVASGTLSWAERENGLSGASADFFNGAFDLRLMPVTKLTFMFKYRHREKDVDNPPSLIDGYYGLSTNSPVPVAGIRPSISSETDRFSGLVRYRPLRELTLYLGYTFKQTDREDASQWNLPSQTKENKVQLSFKLKLPEHLKLTGLYEYADTDNPAYNTIPEKAHEGMLSLSWAGLERVNAFVSYEISRGDTDNVAIDTGATQTVTGNRDADRDRVLASLTFLLTGKVTLNTAYAYMESTVEQDHIYGPTLVTDVRYEERAHSVSVSATVRPRDGIDLSAGVSHTRSKSSFGPDPSGVASFSALDVQETVYTASGRIGLPDKWDLSLQYEFTDFNNRFNNVQNPVFDDGDLHLVLLSVSKKW